MCAGARIKLEEPRFIIMVIRQTVASVCPSTHSATMQSEHHVDNVPQSHGLRRERAANCKQMASELPRQLHVYAYNVRESI